MKEVEVLQTIRYAKFFNYSLTIHELHQWLISPNQYSFKLLSDYLDKHPKLKKKLIYKHNSQQTKLIRQKLKTIQVLISILKLIPTIHLIALTGSLSANNPQEDDDIDLMIITYLNTLWLTRLIVIPLTSLVSHRRKPNTKNINNKICINLWLDQKSLTVPKSKQNLYTAHEVLQIKPLFNRKNTYQQFILANSWSKRYLATAYQNLIISKHNQSEKLNICWNFPFKILNIFAFKLQYLYMKKKITKEHITLHSAYFHPNNPYSRIISYLKP